MVGLEGDDQDQSRLPHTLVATCAPIPESMHKNSINMYDLLSLRPSFTTSRKSKTIGKSHINMPQRSALKSIKRIILGTSSSFRRQLMQELATEHDFAFETASADIDEKAIGERDGSPDALVLLLSHAKAAAIIDKLTSTQQQLEGLLITCDQVVVHNGNILEKPKDEAEARRFIAGYATAPASTISAIVCTDLATRKTCQGVDIATIHFSSIPKDSVDALIKEGEVYWCAGGLMVEHPLVEPHVTRLDGALDSVMGLPKELTLKLLNQAANGF